MVRNTLSCSAITVIYLLTIPRAYVPAGLGTQEELPSERITNIIKNISKNILHYIRIHYSCAKCTVMFVFLDVHARLKLEFTINRLKSGIKVSCNQDKRIC